MKHATFMQQLAVSLAVSLAVTGLCFPPVALAAPPPTAQDAPINDVRLSADGMLHGRVLTAQQTPILDAEVSLRSGDRTLAETRTDRDGCFRFTGLSNGVYQIATAQGEGTYRIWTAPTAPPAAQPRVEIAVDTVRGQWSVMHTFRNLMANPFFVTALIATAVAIPVAIHNSKDSASH